MGARVLDDGSFGRRAVAARERSGSVSERDVVCRWAGTLSQSRGVRAELVVTGELRPEDMERLRRAIDTVESALRPEVVDA